MVRQLTFLLSSPLSVGLQVLCNRLPTTLSCLFNFQELSGFALLDTCPCKAKVANNWNTLAVNKYIGWLQISVHYVARVKEIY